MKNKTRERSINTQKIIIYINIILIIFLIIGFNKVYAADANLVCIPKNPRVGETFTVRANITGTDCYSISFVNLDESLNLEYISMDSEKVATGTTPLTGYIQAKFKVKSEGKTNVSATLKIKSAPLVDNKLDIDNFTEKVVDKNLSINLIPVVTNITEITGKYEVTDNSVNIRPHPSTKYKSLGVYNKGKVVEVTGLTGDWYQIKYNDSIAYMNKNYLKEIIEEKPEEELPNEEEKQEEQEQKQEEVQEKEQKVKSPKEGKDNTIVMVVIALIIAVGVVVALVFLIKQGRTEYYDEDEDDYEDDEYDYDEEKDK